jgi:hypothetical protein
MQLNVARTQSVVSDEETQQDVENAILKGLDYLQQEASLAKLGNLAVVIGHARSMYVSLVTEPEADR